jgi:sugar phosphate isomerase/epimerase
MLSPFQLIEFVETALRVVVAHLTLFPAGFAVPRHCIGGPKVIEQLTASSTRSALSTRDSGQNELVKSPSMSRLAVNQITTNRWSFLEDLITFQSEGFEAAGLWRPKVVEFGEERAIELVRDLGLAVSSLSWAGGFTGAHGASFADAIDDARRALQTAGTMGAECLVLVSGPQAGHIQSHARRLLTEAVKALSDDAADRGVTLALQPMCSLFKEWSFLQSLDDTLAVIDKSGGRVRIAFDVYQLWHEPRLLERLPELAPLTAVVQLSDCNGAPRSEQDRCLPGDGLIPLTAIVRAFDEAGYGGYYELAVWSDELWQSDYRTLLRECRSRFDVLCRRPVTLQTTRS